MPTVRDVLAALETIAPQRHALSFDKVGLQVGNIDEKVTKAVVALDRSLGAVNFAGELGAELLLTHHPLIFNPLSSVDTRTYEGRTIVKLIQQGTSFIAAHTNWDAAVGGINDTLAGLFQLQNSVPFGMSAEVPQLKLIVFCPPDSAERIIEAASHAGAGTIGLYKQCAFFTAGIGTFSAGEGAKPMVGQVGAVESLPETRVEMILRSSQARAIERAVRKVHPYEEPVIEFFQLTSSIEQPVGRIGNLPNPMTLAEFASLTDSLLGVRSWTWGPPTSKIKKVALMGGAADTAWMDAQRLGADVLITGEVKQQHALEATESGMTIIAAGHYQTEQPGCAALCERMQALVPEVGWNLFKPEPGRNGRPF